MVEVGLCQLEEGVLVGVSFVPGVKDDGALVSGQPDREDRLAELDRAREACIELLGAHEDGRGVYGRQRLVSHAKCYLAILTPGDADCHAHDGGAPVGNGFLDEDGREEELAAIVVVANPAREVLVDAVVHAGLQLGVAKAHGCRANLKPRACILYGPVGGIDGVGDVGGAGVHVDKNDHGFGRRVAEDLGGHLLAVVILSANIEERVWRDAFERNELVDLLGIPADAHGSDVQSDRLVLSLWLCPAHSQCPSIRFARWGVVRQGSRPAIYMTRGNV